MKKYRTALYCRKSKEDDDSIEIQEVILKAYVEDKPEFIVFDTYIDNGVSGIDFSRPAWKQLWKDMHRGLINCIVVKDLSRLGRNKIEVQDILENFFPQKGVRVIAIGDSYDSLKISQMGLELSVKNLLNDWESKDASRKVHHALDAKMKKGEVGSKIPYGYVKSGKTMEIEPTQAEVVRSIFGWILEGRYITYIINKLKEHEILSPSGNATWNDRTIKRMLRDTVYCGDYETGLRRMKMRKPIDVTEEQINHFTDHHEGIVSREIFDEVQLALDVMKNRRNLTEAAINTLDPLQGLAYCALCGKALSYIRANPKTRVKTAKYYCRHHTGNNIEGEKLEKRPEITAETMFAEISKQCNEHLDFLKNTKVEFELEDGLAVTEEIRERQHRLEEEQEALLKGMYSTFECYTKKAFDEEELKRKVAPIKKRRAEIEQALAKILVEKYYVTTIESIRREVLTENNHMDTFDDKTVRRIVSNIFLQEDGMVNVKFKLNIALDALSEHGFQMPQ